LLLACVPAAASAATVARPDSSHHASRPFSVMLRSAAIPGWGQAYNRKYMKAVTVLAGEGLLAYQAWNEFQNEKDALDRHDQAYQASIDRGDPYPNLDPAVLAADDERIAHLNRKINWIWWGVAAHMLNMIDAYVDAHLATFEADFGPPDEGARLEAGPRLGAGTRLDAGPRLTLAVRTRF